MGRSGHNPYPLSYWYSNNALQVGMQGHSTRSISTGNKNGRIWLTDIREGNTRVALDSTSLIDPSALSYANNIQWGFPPL